jgi:hypothetical protein
MRTDWRKVVKDLSPHALAKKSANVWLEAQYGWNALFVDIKSFAKTWSKNMLPTARNLMQRAVQRYSAQSVTDVGSLATVYPDGDTSASWDSYVTNAFGHMNSRGGMMRIFPRSHTVTLRVGCQQVERPLSQLEQIYRKLDAFGMSASNVLETIWELCPYSFVVDWFLDLQKIKSSAALNRLHQADVRNLVRSYKRTYTYDGEIVIGANPYSWIPGTIYYNKWPTGMYGDVILPCQGGSYIEYNRYADDAFVDTSRSLFLQNGLSTTRGISALSLIVQRLLK